MAFILQYLARLKIFPGTVRPQISVTNLRGDEINIPKEPPKTPPQPQQAPGVVTQEIKVTPEIKPPIDEKKPIQPQQRALRQYVGQGGMTPLKEIGTIPLKDAGTIPLENNTTIPLKTDTAIPTEGKKQKITGDLDISDTIEYKTEEKKNVGSSS